jgi:radical SAM protein with 4Fe4S-binding SPASM domain
MLMRYDVPVRPGFVLMQENENEESETRQWMHKFMGMPGVSPDIIRFTPDSRCSRGVHFSRTLWQRKLRIQAGFSKVTREHFERHQTGHPCLYGSLCVHHDGEVYPCVMDRTRRLGNVKNSSLAEIAGGKAAVAVWRQSMDRVDSCRDCEFRFACCDCRPEAAGIHALLSSREHPDFSVKNPCCLYNPYTGVWDEADPLLAALTEISLKAVPEDKDRRY